MTNTPLMTGGCLCGAVRYEIEGEPFLVNHCHCRSCRRHTGGPVVTLAGFRSDQVRFSGVARKLFESSPGVHRAFCNHCGTPLSWEGDGGDLGPILEIHISTFDDPNSLRPTAHAFDAERIPWFDTADRLPRYAGFVDDHPPARQGPDQDLL